MSQKRPRKRPKTRSVRQTATPEVSPSPRPSAPAEIAFEPEAPLATDEHGYLAIGLTAGALAVVAFLVVLILMAAN